MFIPHIALVAETVDVSMSQVALLSAAIQKQVARDFGPLWNLQATVDAFPTQNDVPLGYWHVVIRDDIDNPAAQGFHKTLNNQPFALVQFNDDDWTIDTSHEVLEMLADPSGDRMVASQPVIPEQDRVQYLVEVCDPVQKSHYPVNGIELCDFYTPKYFDPVAVAGVRYSFTGAVTEPRQVIQGGYLTFVDPQTGQWWQKRWFEGASAAVVEIEGPETGSVVNSSLREAIDRITPSHRKMCPSSESRVRDKRRGQSLGAVERPLTGFEHVSDAVLRILARDRT